MQTNNVFHTCVYYMCLIMSNLEATASRHGAVSAGLETAMNEFPSWVIWTPSALHPKVLSPALNLFRSKAMEPSILATRKLMR